MMVARGLGKPGCLWAPSARGLLLLPSASVLSVATWVGCGQGGTSGVSGSGRLRPPGCRKPHPPSLGAACADIRHRRMIYGVTTPDWPVYRGAPRRSASNDETDPGGDPWDTQTRPTCGSPTRKEPASSTCGSIPMLPQVGLVPCMAPERPPRRRDHSSHIRARSGSCVPKCPIMPSTQAKGWRHAAASSCWREDLDLPAGVPDLGDAAGGRHGDRSTAHVTIDVALELVFRLMEEQGFHDPVLLLPDQ